MGEKGLM